MVSSVHLGEITMFWGDSEFLLLFDFTIRAHQPSWYLAPKLWTNTSNTDYIENTQNKKQCWGWFKHSHLHLLSPCWDMWYLLLFTPMSVSFWSIVGLTPLLTLTGFIPIFHMIYPFIPIYPPFIHEAHPHRGSHLFYIPVSKDRLGNSSETMTMTLVVNHLGLSSQILLTHFPFHITF